MGQLLHTGSCPVCHQGANTACYAEYTDGYKCFSCGASKSYNKEQQGFLLPRPALSEIIKKIDLPDFVSDPQLFNLELKQWLYSYYLDNKLIRKYNILAADNSLLFLSHQDGEIQFYQQRFFPNKRLINHGKKVVHKFEAGHKIVILTEDYISAVRAHEADADSWCLFGTTLNYSDVGLLLDKYNKIYIWLDGDQAGQKGAVKIAENIKRRINYVKKKYPYKYTQEYIVKNIQTSKDPKEYSPTEIERTIWGLG